MKPLRILSVVNVPWDTRLGAARVWMELDAEWERAGHVVTKFCLDDAFPQPAPSGARAALRLLRFPSRAAAFIRERSGEFDVIDALIGTLPFAKNVLRHRGLLVARSVGLFHMYEKFERAQQLPRRLSPSSLFFDYFGAAGRRASRKSLETADLLNVPNEQEAAVVRDELHCSTASVVLPYGLTNKQIADFESAARPSADRLAGKQVCFVGMWSRRKGSRDWGAIIAAVRERIPDARFLFLGTMVENAIVLRDLALRDSSFVEIVPHYEPGELPQLLSRAAVGVFPSYVEGFGLAVIEQLAAGIPTIAYDAAGPREILGPEFGEMLTQAGDVSGVAERVVRLLQRDEVTYRHLSERCRLHAARFRWSEIAERTIAEYAARLPR